MNENYFMGLLLDECGFTQFDLNAKVRTALGSDGMGTLTERLTNIWELVAIPFTMFDGERRVRIVSINKPLY